MIIEKIHIRSFGALIEKTVEPTQGLNIIEGKNECGKSTVAMFIKFIFYGLSSKATGDDAVSERAKYVNWSTGVASGDLTFSSLGKRYRIDRSVTLSQTPGGRENYRELLKVTDLDTEENIKLSKSPGEYFLGFPEKVFMQSAFVKNIDGAKVDGVSLKVALENLISSGDEEINTKRALEKIDGVRKMLKHKSGLGGKIVELSAEKRDLTELLLKSQDVTKEIVDLEGTLADVGVKIKRREDETASLAAVCRAYEAVRIGRRVRDIEKSESAVKFLMGELDTMDKNVDRHLLAKIDLCRGSIDETERDAATLREKKAELEEKCVGRAEDIPQSPETVVKKAAKLKKSATAWLALGVVFALLGVAFVAGAFFLEDYVKDIFSYFKITALALGALFIVLFIVGIIVSSVKRSAFKGLLKNWQSEDLDELRDAALSKSEEYEYTRKLLDKIEQIDAVIAEAVSRNERESARGAEFCEVLGIKTEGGNISEALGLAKEAAEAMCEKRDSMNARLENEKGKLAALLEEIGESERLGAEDRERAALESIDREKILSMTKDDYAEAVRQRNFADSQVKALRQRENELEKRVTALRAAGETPSEIAGRISCIDAEISALTFKYNALVTAYNALERAGEKMRGDVIPEIAKRASKIMGYVTAGKYQSLSSGENLELAFSSDGERRPVDYLSEGTKDAAYISMRIALAETMYSGNTPAMIFDECFARMDAGRLRGILEMLSAEECPQSLVFTCRSLEASVLPEANVIRL